MSTFLVFLGDLFLTGLFVVLHSALILTMCVVISAFVGEAAKVWTNMNAAHGIAVGYLLIGVGLSAVPVYSVYTIWRLLWGLLRG